MTLKPYQQKLADDAKILLHNNKKVGLDIFARGGKSFISMELMRYLIENEGCKYIAVVAPKSVVLNLEYVQFKNFKYKNRLVFVNKELLSRRYSLESCIEATGHDVDAILFDEAHTLFGDNISRQLSSEYRFVYSKFVIAMTATPKSNLKGIDALELMVGKDNILHFDFGMGLKQNIIRPLTYIPGVLSYDKRCYNELLAMKESLNYNAYIFEQIDKLLKIVENTNCELEDKVFNYIKDRIKLSSADGGRVFVFFNTISDVLTHEEVVKGIVKRLYEYWGNKDVCVKYIPYTSENSKEEDKVALDVIGSAPTKNQIDIISTVNRGAYSIHPSDVHFGLIMCGTQSIVKYMQIVGRATNLTDFDVNDTTIFDLRDNKSFIGRTTISIGRKPLESRRKYRRHKALSQFNDGVFDDESLSNVKLKSCKELENTMVLYDRIKNLSCLYEGTDEILDIINNNISIIDNQYNGNIPKYLKMLSTIAENQVDKDKYKKLMDKYIEIRRALLFDGFTKKDRSQMLAKFEFLGYRLYLGEKDSREEEEYAKNLYTELKELEANFSNKKLNAFVNTYAIDYLTNKMNSNCYTLIHSNDKVTDKILHSINKVLDSSSIDSELVEHCKKCISLSKKLSKKAAFESRFIDYITLRVVRRYLEKVSLSDQEEVLVDNLLVYVDRLYPNALTSFEDLDYLDKDKLERIIDIIVAYKNDTLDINGKKLDSTISVITRAKKLDELHIIYYCTLKYFGIKSIHDFNTKITNKSRMVRLVNEALANKDRSKILELESYMNKDDLPQFLIRKINRSSIHKLNADNCTDREIIIAVMNLSSGNPNDEKLLKQVVRKKRMSEDNIIRFAFSARMTSREKLNLDNMLENGECDSNLLYNAVDINSVTIKNLNKLSESNILSHKYKEKVDRIIDLYTYHYSNRWAV